MKYLSLFSGIGGFELGIQQAYEENNEGNGNSIKPEEQPKKRSLPNTRTSTDTPDSNGNGWGAGPACIGFSEIDKYACQVYNKHFNHNRSIGISS